MDKIATPTDNTRPLQLRFASLADALDYAAEGCTGYNFYGGRGEHHATLTYSELRTRSLELARRLAGLGLEPGARAAFLADTNPDSIRFFFACQYAGLVPVPLSASLHLGSHRAYVAQLRHMLVNCGAEVAMAAPNLLPYLQQAAEGLPLRFVGEPAAFDDLAAGGAALRPLGPTDTAFLQYTSGTTQFVRGVVVTQAALMNNLLGILKDGLAIRAGDRAVSWLPYYHDMGFVGFVLAPMAAQRVRGLHEPDGVRQAAPAVADADLGSRSHDRLQPDLRVRALLAAAPAGGHRAAGSELLASGRRRSRDDPAGCPRAVRRSVRAGRL